MVKKKKLLKLEMSVEDFCLLHEMLCNYHNLLENTKIPYGVICHEASFKQMDFGKKLNQFTEKVYALIEWEKR
jgi:hypothetical protein